LDAGRDGLQIVELSLRRLGLVLFGTYGVAIIASWCGASLWRVFRSRTARWFGVVLQLRAMSSSIRTRIKSRASQGEPLAQFNGIVQGAEDDLGNGNIALQVTTTTGESHFDRRDRNW